jgi:hypothetical protein
VRSVRVLTVAEGGVAGGMVTDKNYVLSVGISFPTNLIYHWLQFKIDVGDTTGTTPACDF